MADLTQWVNLPKKDAYVGDGISSDLRLDTVKLKAKFKTDDLASCKIRLVADGSDNIEYSAAEVNRWTKYKKLPIAFSPQLNASKTELEFDGEFELPAAGGNTYKFEALYKGEVKATSKTIETKRRIYFEVIPMEGITAPSKGDLESALKKVFETDNIAIECKEVGGRSKKISKLKTITSDADYTNIDRELKAAVTSDDHKPHVIPIAFVDYIAKYETIDVSQDIEIGFDQKLISYVEDKDYFITVKIKSNSGQNRYLFYNFNDEMDKKKEWLEYCQIEDKNGTIMGSISRDNVVSQNLLEIKFKVDFKLANFLSEDKGKVNLKVKVFKSASNGYAWRSAVVVGLRTLADINGNRKDKKPGDYMPTIKHELGHVFKQAATGSCAAPTTSGPDKVTFLDRSSPDAHANLYGQYHKDCGTQTNNLGHQGPHCKSGATYKKADAKWEKSGDVCIMYGSSGLGERSDFCSDCKDTLRKVDIYKS